MPIVTFSVPQDIYEKIQSNASTNESENLAAKRLLLGVLGVESPGAISSDFGDRLSEIEDHLKVFDQRLEDLEQEQKNVLGMASLWESVHQQQKDLAVRIESLSNPETAIMIQKQPLPPVAVEIQRTHEEAAQDWGKTLATVKRWAKDPDKWPEGWLWDGDKNFWVKEV